MTASETRSDERKSWLYVFVILLLVSFWLLVLRLLNLSFLVLDFELVVVYIPTILAGIIVVYTMKLKR